MSRGLEAVGLRPAAWDPLFSHRDVGPLMMPILLLARGNDELDLEVDDERLDELFAEAPEMAARHSRDDGRHGSQSSTSRLAYSRSSSFSQVLVRWCMIGLGLQPSRPGVRARTS